MYVIMYVGQDAMDRKGKKVRFLKSEKIGKKKSKKNAAAYTAERPLFID